MRNREASRLAVGALVLASFVFLGSLDGFGLTLIGKDRPAAVIVVAAKPADTVHYAAAELQDYLRQITGVTLPIRTHPEPKRPAIYLGESEWTRKLGITAAGLKTDGFKILSGDTWLAIVGRDYSGPPIHGVMNPWNHHEVYNDRLKLGAFGEAGTLYGVYRFLEEVGHVRWYMPGDLGTVVPKRDSIVVDNINLQVAPDFPYRYSWFCNFAVSEPDARWFRRAGFGAPYPAQCIHSFWMFQKYKDAHPEYFALIGGKRDFANLSCIGGGGNLCLSNPGVVKRWIMDICEYFKNNPQQSIFPLAPNDGMTKICECPTCRASLTPGDLALGESGKFSNYFWTFADKVARGVGERYPDKFVGSIAYGGCNIPPTRLKTLSPHLAVMICQSRNSFADPKAKASAKGAIDGWRAKTPNIYLWEYYLISWGAMRGLPAFFPHLIAQDIRSLKGISRGEFIEAESDVGGTGKNNYPGMTHLNLYLTAKLLWQADRDVDELLAEYYEQFYGPAHEPMKEFWTLGERIWMTRSTLGNPINMYPKADLDRLAACLDRAIARAPAGSIYRKRVELIQSEFLPAKRKLSNVLVLHPPRLVLNKSAGTIQVDGLLNEDAWKKAAPFGFVDKNGETAQFTTWGYAAWDDQNLYLAFLNYEPEMTKLTARAATRDQNYGPGMWEDDSIEIFLNPSPADPTSYYQFIINAKGVIWDGRITGGKSLSPNVEWNSAARAAARREPNRWVLEVRVPLTDIGITPPVEGKTLAANFFRNRYCGGPVVYSCWSPSLSIQHANPDRFGRIAFERN